MNTLGIVGGIAPESTVAYYRQIIALYRAKNPDGSNPHIIVNSIDLTFLLSLAASNKLSELTDYMAEAVDVLVKAGADIALFASNTPHLVFDAVQGRSAIPLISIVTTTCAEAEGRGLCRLGLVGTKFTMQAAFYRDVGAKAGITIVSPNAEEQEIIHSRYMGELILGVFQTGTRNEILATIEKFAHRENLDAVILAGTELPLLLQTNLVGNVPMLDTTEIHVRAAISRVWNL